MDLNMHKLLLTYLYTHVSIEYYAFDEKLFFIIFFRLGYLIKYEVIRQNRIIYRVKSYRILENWK